MTKTPHWFAIAALVIFNTSMAQGGVVTLTPTDDGHAIDSNPADGTFDTLDLTNGQMLIRNSVGNNPFTGPFSYEEETAMEFDLSSVPLGSTINSASLTVSAVGFPVGSGIFDAKLEGYAGNGVIDLSDFPLPSNTIDTLMFGPSIVFELYTSDVTSFVQQLFDNSETHAGFGFRALAVSAAQDSFGRIESLEAFPPPSLEIDFTVIPEPSTLAFITLGLLSVGFVARRRRF